MPNITIDNITKSYNHNIFKNLSLSVDKPGVYLIAGPNGSGKTTLLETIVGLRKSNSGKIVINNNISGSIGAKQSVGFLSQQNSLRKTIKLREEMQLVKEVFGIEVDDIKYLTKYNLQDDYNSLTRTLSGGTQRRFLIAMLFLAQQDIVILDEPASGLDTYSRDEIWNIINEYGRNHIVLVSDHYLNQARLYSDRIILLNNGEIIANDTFTGLKNKCDCDHLIKVRAKEFKHTQEILKQSGIDYEVKVSGTVYNIYLKDQSACHIDKLSDENISVHELDLEDIYFYMTGKECNTEEI